MPIFPSEKALNLKKAAEAMKKAEIKAQSKLIDDKLGELLKEESMDFFLRSQLEDQQTAAQTYTYTTTGNTGNGWYGDGPYGGNTGTTVKTAMDVQRQQQEADRIMNEALRERFMRRQAEDRLRQRYVRGNFYSVPDVQYDDDMVNITLEMIGGWSKIMRVRREHDCFRSGRIEIAEQAPLDAMPMDPSEPITPANIRVKIFLRAGQFLFKEVERDYETPKINKVNKTIKRKFDFAD